MKNIFALAIALLLTTGAFAQKGFEGSLVYNISVKGEGSEQMKAFMPSKMEVMTAKDGSSRVKMDGMMPQDIVTIKGQSYMLKSTEKVAYKMPAKAKAGEKKEGDPKVTVTKTDETLKIVGYDCQKYSLDVEVKGPDGGTQSIPMTVWTTEKIKISDDAKGDMFQGIGAKVPGMVMKMKMGMGPVEMEFLVSEVKQVKQEATLFKLPTDYAVKDFDPAAMGGMGF